MGTEKTQLSKVGSKKNKSKLKMPVSVTKRL